MNRSLLKFKKGGKVLTWAGNITLIYSCLSCISKLDSIEKVVEFIKGISSELESIIVSLGRFISLLLYPWDWLKAFILDLINYTLTPLDSLLIDVILVALIGWLFPARYLHRWAILQKSKWLIKQYRLLNYLVAKDRKQQLSVYFNNLQWKSLRLIGPITHYVITLSEGSENRFYLNIGQKQLRISMKVWK